MNFLLLKAFSSSPLSRSWYLHEILQYLYSRKKAFHHDKLIPFLMDHNFACKILSHNSVSNYCSPSILRAGVTSLPSPFKCALRFLCLVAQITQRPVGAMHVVPMKSFSIKRIDLSSIHGQIWGKKKITCLASMASQTNAGDKGTDSQVTPESIWVAFSISFPLLTGWLAPAFLFVNVCVVSLGLVSMRPG